MNFKFLPDLNIVKEDELLDLKENKVSSKWYKYQEPKVLKSIPVLIGSKDGINY